MDKDMNITTFLRIFGTVVAGVFVLVILTGSWVNIPQGQVGVVFDKARGGVLPITLGEGWHFKTPLVQWIQEYPVALRTYTDTGDGDGMVSLPTLEGQHIDQQLSVVYNVSSDKASFVFDKFQGAAIESIEQSFIHQTVKSVAGNITGSYSLMDIYGPKKQEIQNKITTDLQSQLSPWGFNVDRVNLGSAKFPQSIEASLQQKISAQQDAEKARFKLTQAEIDAKARIAQAEGEAKANQLIQNSLTPKLVHLKAIEKWDGQLPRFTLGASTPILDLRAEQKNEK